MAKELAKLFVTLGLDDSDFQKSLNNVQKSLTQAGKIMTGIGAAIVGTFTLSIKTFVETGDELLYMSEKTGISVKALSELKYAAGVADISLEDLQTGFRGMANLMEGANDGSKTAIETLNKLGLSLDELRGLDSEQLFMKISSAVASVNDPVMRAALAVDVFGRSGMELLPMLADGAEGIANLRQKANELGVVMDEDVARKAHELSISFDNVKESIKGVFLTIGNVISPTIKEFSDELANIISNLVQWAKANPELAQQLIILAGVLGAVDLVLGAILWVLPAIAAEFTILLGPVGLAVLAVNALILAMTLLALNWNKVVSFFTRNERDLTNVTQEESRKQALARKEALDKEASDLDNSYNAQILDLRKIYGILENEEGDYQKTKMDLARTASDDRRKQIGEEISALQDAHDESMRLLQDEYDAKFKDIDQGTKIARDSVEAQISSIEDSMKADEKARREKENQDKLAALKDEYVHAKTTKERKAAEDEYTKLLAQINQDRIDESRQQQIDELNKQITFIGDQAVERKNALSDELDDERQHEQDLLDLQVKRLNTERDNLDQALKEELTRLDDERKAYEKLYSDIYQAEKTAIDNQRALNDEFFAPIPATNSTPISSKSTWDTFLEMMKKLAGFDLGGRVPGPAGQPYLAVVHGGEYIIPNSQAGVGRGNIEQHFHIAQLVVREKADVERIARQLQRMAVVRV